jgi:phospholipid/cholesterol/gamma-HCH transport system substrate-binding protein
MGLALALVGLLIAGVVVATRSAADTSRSRVVGYFANSNGIFPGDEVRILGVPVGKIDTIEPQPNGAKITFWFNDTYKVPADAKAVILSPSLVAVRAIQLTPAWTSGPTMASGATIPRDRTAVPVEFDDLRQQLEKLTDTLQPTQPGGVSTLGQFINTAADNLRGQGPDIRDALIKLSQAFSALGDHSTDLVSTISNLSTLVTALQSSKDLLVSLNQNLASTTGLLSNNPDGVAHALTDVNSVVDDVHTFVANNRETLGKATDQLASITNALNDSLPDVKQTLHIAAPAFSNFVNIYQPAQGTLTGALAVNNFANPIQFLCSAVQAASRLGAEQAAKLCVQYLAPIIKDRQYNFPPLGVNPFVGATARPNEITYSEDWLRPDYIPPPDPASAAAPAAPPPAPLTAETPAASANTTPPNAGPAPDDTPEDTQATDPTKGLEGLMAPPGAGS